MPTLVDDFSPWKFVNGFDVQLRDIDPANGYNTRPTILKTFESAHSIEESQLPALFVEPLLMQEDVDQHAFGKNRQEWVMAVWGYFRDDYDPRRVGLALLADILAAIWRDETLNQQGGIDFPLRQVRFDFESLHEQNRGVLVAAFGGLVDLERSSTP